MKTTIGILLTNVIPVLIRLLKYTIGWLMLFALCLIFYVKNTSSLIQSSRTGEKSQKQANSIDIAQASWLVKLDSMIIDFSF